MAAGSSTYKHVPEIKHQHMLKEPRKLFFPSVRHSNPAYLGYIFEISKSDLEWV